MSTVRSFVTAALVLASASGCTDPHSHHGPDMEGIRATFAAHRPAFDELDAMLREDRRCARSSSDFRGDILTAGEDNVCDFWKDGRRWDGTGFSPRCAT